MHARKWFQTRMGKTMDIIHVLGMIYVRIHVHKNLIIRRKRKGQAHRCIRIISSGQGGDYCGA